MDNLWGNTINVEKACRLCMTSKRTLISLFASSSDSSPTFATKLLACTNIEIKSDDVLPSKICLKCVVSLNSSYDFKMQCEDSERTLRRLFGSAPTVIDQKDSSEEEGSAATRASPVCVEAPVVKVELNEGEDDDDDDDLPLHELVETTLREKRSYVKRNPRKSYDCEPCGKSFFKRNVFIKHNIKFHGANEDEAQKVYSCQICDEPFQKWAELMDHEKLFRHHGKEKCSYCSKMFSRAYMGEHMRKHTGERPFLCPHCGRSFYMQTSFQHHTMRCSNSEKKYQCSYCGQRFFLSFGLKEHIRIHTNEKPHVCGTCGKAFRRSTKLKQHELTHSDDRPYICPVCNRGFRQSQHLKEHMRIHTGVKPYVCDVCDAAFTQGHCLKTHRLKHDAN